MKVPNLVVGTDGAPCIIPFINHLSAAGPANRRHQDVPARQIRRRQAVPGAGGVRAQGPGKQFNRHFVHFAIIFAIFKAIFRVRSTIDTQGLFMKNTVPCGLNTGNRIEGAIGCPSWCRPLYPLLYMLCSILLIHRVQSPSDLYIRHLEKIHILRTLF